MEEKSYQINGRRYIQRKLVLGQLLPLIKVLEGIDIASLDAVDVIKALGPNLPQIAAIILIPEGAEAGERDLAALAAEFADRMEFETALEVAADFLSFNPLSSLSRRLRGVIGATIENLSDALQSMSS